MSQWTYVAGTIRVDGFPDLLGLSHDEEKEQIEKMVGSTCDYDSPPEQWDACNVPCGSEGSIQRRFMLTGYDKGIGHSISRGVVSIWGDLRRYENEREIVEWFKAVIKKFEALDSSDNKYGFSIRDAMLSVEVEGRQHKTFCIADGKDIVTKRIKRKQE